MCGSDFPVFTKNIEGVFVGTSSSVMLFSEHVLKRMVIPLPFRIKTP